MMRLTYRAAALAVCVAGLAVAPQAAEVTIYRDTWGVPHIYADTPADAAYGLGYAMAEDRLADIHQNAHIALGTAAEHFGPGFVQTDFAMRLARNAALCREYWPNAPDHVRVPGDRFVEGVKAYAAEHPEAVPDYAIELEGWHTAAIGRTMILQWPLGTLMDDLKGKPERSPFASNGWAVSPSRSADNCAILLTDPHLTWEHVALFYEARVFGGELVMNGFFICGTPLIGLGHTEHVGWACTTGGPDTSDVYMLPARKAALGFEYQYEGEWRMPQLKVFTIKVKGEDRPRVMPAAYTVHGPLLAEPDLDMGVVYAGKTPYMDDTGFVEQQYAMCMAKNAHEFFEALGMNSFMEQNIIFADREGNIGYARVGRTPIRPDGPWDWSRPVPGDTAATQWLGIHDIRDLVWIMNPEQGYLQNCNISPQQMMVDSPLTPDRYPSYIYNVSWDKSNPRGRRAVQLLEEHDRITVEDAKAITMDVYDLLAAPWQEALQAALAAAGDGPDEETRAAAESIARWDGQFTAGSEAAPVYRQWRLNCAEAGVDVEAIAGGKALPGDQQELLLQVLSKTLAEMRALYGDRWPVTWGDVHVVGRSGQYFPCDGADFGRGANGTETLRDVESSEQPKGSGRLVARSGSMSAMLMFFHKDGIESYTTTQWGQSANPDSPHHVDQARELFGPRRMKPAWFTKASLLENLASEKVLSVP